MRRIIIELVSWILSVLIGIGAFIIGKGVYKESMHHVIRTVQSHQFTKLTTEDYWWGIATPIITFLIGVLVAKLIANLFIKIFAKTLYIV